MTGLPVGGIGGPEVDPPRGGLLHSGRSCFYRSHSDRSRRSSSRVRESATLFRWCVYYVLRLWLWQDLILAHRAGERRTKFW
jgi:hypothetical protein